MPFNGISIEIEEDPAKSTSGFLNKRRVGIQNYIASRVLFSQRLFEPACLVAHQSIESLTKGILTSLSVPYRYDHNLLKLLKKCGKHSAAIKTLIDDAKVKNLCKELEKSYMFLRFGEAKFSIDETEILPVLDKIAYELIKAYTQALQEPKLLLFVPDDFKKIFLANNNFFSQSDLTDEPIALLMPV